MPLNIRNVEVERLAEEVARLSNTSTTEAIRQALLDRKQKLAALGLSSSRADRLRSFLEHRVWPTLPPEASQPWTKEQEEAALGYGPGGEPA